MAIWSVNDAVDIHCRLCHLVHCTNISSLIFVCITPILLRLNNLSPQFTLQINENQHFRRSLHVIDL